MSDKKDRQSASTKANADKTAEKENFFDISHNGKDITFKDLTSRHISKPFEVLGLEDIKIKKSIEKELPAVTANIHMGDDIFLLEENTFLIVDYESSFLPKNRIILTCKHDYLYGNRGKASISAVKS